jgi:hypothetical protein
MVTKICRFDGKICRFASCSYVDSMGNVRACSRLKNRSGFHALRRQVSPVVSIFNKHLRLFVFVCFVSCGFAVVVGGNIIRNGAVV